LGSTGCPCLPTPTDEAAAFSYPAPGKPEYVGEDAAYGYECEKHDDVDNATDCQTKTADGEANDWCKDKWCIVDKDNCDHYTRTGTYRLQPEYYFSYETCEGTSFKGNGWVGRCKNCAMHHETSPKSWHTTTYLKSFCTCGGLSTCKCKPGDTKQEPAWRGTKMAPSYVGTVESYGYGCMAHDKGQDTCNSSTKTGVGKDDDWCLDQWCIVDKDACDFKAWNVTYSKQAGDWFSYETCDASFKGNGWVGRCKCADNVKTYCTCSKGNSTTVTTTGAVSALVSGAPELLSATVPQVVMALALVLHAC